MKRLTVRMRDLRRTLLGRDDENTNYMARIISLSEYICIISGNQEPARPSWQQPVMILCEECSFHRDTLPI